MSNENLRMPMTWQSGLRFAEQIGPRATSPDVVIEDAAGAATIYPNLCYDP
jgi:hypothetical protein